MPSLAFEALWRPVQILGLFARSRYSLAILAGLVLAASFPPLGIGGLAWIAPGVILASAMGRTGGEAFRIGYVSGLAHYLASLYWLLLIPYRWHGIPFGPAAGWLALSGFLALFPATWVWLLAPPGLARGGQPGLDSPTLLESIDARLSCSWGRRTLRSLAGAALWVAMEMLLARIFGGFPWNPLGASQHRLSPLLQIASVTGIYGVSFVAVWFSLSLLSAASVLIRRPASRAACLAEMAIPALLVAIVFNLGFRQLTHVPPPSRVLNVTLVQPSIPQTLIWDSGSDDTRFREVLQLTEQALTNRTDLLIWPESAIPKLLRYDKDTFEAVTGLARRHHVWMIIGADDAEPKLRAPGEKTEAEYYNSSFLIDPEGHLVKNYRKRNLVVFGEYIPLVRWLPFLKWFTPIQGGFTPGDTDVSFELGGIDVSASVLICFEDTFPHVARKGVSAQTDFLVNLTNDGWFGESAAQWQHAMSALPRAVENRRPLIRCTNNGITCWIDATGGVRQMFRDRQGTPYGPGFMAFELPLPPRGQALTFYTAHGDVFGWSCSAAGVLLLVDRLRRRSPNPAENQGA